VAGRAKSRGEGGFGPTFGKNMRGKGAYCLERDETGRWAGFALDLPVAVWGKASPEEVERSLARGLALAILERREAGRALPLPGRALTPEEEAEREMGTNCWPT
jgi:hypothetical protein